MKRTLVGVFVGILVVSVWSCSNGSSKSTDDNGSANLAVEDGGSVADVECTHPGAGKPIAGDRCECTTTRNVAGEWAAMRTCREGDTCPAKDREDTVVLTQNGTTIRAERGSAYSFGGTLCGDIMVWSGGAKDGLNPECGVIRFADDNQYVSDSCYVAAGECARTHSQGCPSLKGQCTGTGVKKPGAATPIRKVICS